MSKYDPLRSFLGASDRSMILMSFGDIEDLLGFPLPHSARRHRAWWSNSTTNGVITNAWLEAGYKSSDVDMDSERVVFRRTISSGPRRSPPAKTSIVAVLKGTITLVPGSVITGPSGELWDAET